MTNYNLLLLLLLIPSISASSSAPWQSAMTPNALEEKTYKDMPPIVFSGSGRLHSVEAIVAASVSKEDTSANLCVSIVCTDGIVILSTMTKSPHLELEVQDGGIPLLLDEEERISAPCSKIAPGLFCATGGNAVDSQLLRDKIHQIATSLYESADAGQLVTPSRVSAAMVARQLADHLQRPTQTLSAGSMLAVRAYYS
jgi:20S proteasome alpha/beta subunit